MTTVFQPLTTVVIVMWTFMPAFSLKTKMSLAVSLFVTVVISALALSAIWYFEGELKNTISRHQFTMVSAMAEEIDSKIQNAQHGLIAVAEIAPSDLAENPIAAQKFLDTHRGIRTVFDSSIFIFSPAGTLIAASPAEPHLQGKDYSFRDYIRNTITTGRPQISMPFLSTQSHHHPIVMFTAPIFDARGKMTGILAGALDLMRGNFLGKLATVKLGEKGYLYLYSTDRTLIVHHDRSRILRRDVPVGANRLFDLAIKGFEGTGETVTSRGLHALSSFKRLKSSNWILAANFPQSEAYAPIYRAKWYLLAASVMALILSNLIVWWFMRHLTAPLLHFTRHVKGITGRVHDPDPIRIESKDEIGTLARAFNEMLAELDEQKKTIRLQKEFSENLLMNSAVPTFVLDTRHRVIIWNKACEELTGMKGERILGTTDQWKAFYRKERTVLADIVIDGNTGDLPLYYESHNNSPFTADGLQAEGWCLTSDNRERYLFFDAAPVRNAGGEIIAVIETVQDITGRRRAEEELDLKNVILSTQQETSMDGILLVDGNNSIISYNQRFVDLWGIPPELVEAKDDAPVLQLVTTQVVDSEGFVARVKHLYEHREEKSREEILLKDGRVIDRYSAPVLAQDGKYLGRVWYLRDITERKRIEVELWKSESVLRKVFDSIPDLLSVIDRDLRIVRSNWQGGYEYVPEEKRIGNPHCFDAFYPEQGRPCDNCHTLKVFRTGRPVATEKYNPRIGLLEIRVFPIFDDSGEVVMVAEHIRNITEQKRLEEELRKAHKLESLGVLAGGIAHDFNNLLTGILGNISLAKIMTESNTKPFKRLDEAEKAVSRARDLTQQLMTFSKGGAPVKKTASMEQIVKDSVSFVLSGSNVRCRFSVPEGVWPVEVDEGQMNQVINNLIINADQSMVDGGIIEICFENMAIAPDNDMSLKEGRYLKITIRDHGAGIPEQHLHRIFDPYFTTKRKGSGLGLATVYSIIRNHDGYVGVESTTGAGATFQLYVPASDKGMPQVTEIRENLHAGSGRVLVMDDEDIIRDVAAEILGHLGYSAVACCDGNEAIELYRQALATREPYIAVIMDLTIPGGMGGKEAAARILEIDPDAVLIVSSGYSDDPVVADFRQHGFSGTVPKPFDAEGLAMELKRLITHGTPPSSELS
jgi:PAS domain S-box-containing protein